MTMKSWARTVLRPFDEARLVACWISQPTQLLSPSIASPAVLQPAALIAARTLLPTRSTSPAGALPAFFFALAIWHLPFAVGCLFYHDRRRRRKTARRPRGSRGTSRAARPPAPGRPPGAPHPPARRVAR